MKRLYAILLFAFAVVVTSCRSTGTHTVVSGIEEAKICFTSDKAFAVDVSIDGKSYRTNTVKGDEYKAKRDIRNTARQALSVTPGKHDVTVTGDGKELYKQKIFISTGETKMIKIMK